LKIKELEKLLSISRSNIRFYEKQGLLSPGRKDNNYREYTEQDIEVLKKIIIFRKMGLTVEEIKLIQKDELPFNEAIAGAQQRIENEIEQLNGSLKLIKRVAQASSSFDQIHIDEHWNAISESEKLGEKFVDICKDYLDVLLSSNLLFTFFYDFNKTKAKYGLIIACIIPVLLSALRGICSVIFWKKSFWSAFLYPFKIALIVLLITLPLFLLGMKFPKAASVITTVLLSLCFIFLAGVVCLFIYACIA